MDIEERARMKIDDAGNRYDDMQNIRITYVPSEKRPEAKNWAGQDVMRVQAYPTGICL